jgi:hypothetical protein
MNRPVEADYNSQVAYTRALEAYCDTLAQPVHPDHIVDANKMVQPAQEPVTTVTSESENPDVTMSWWHEPPLPVGTPLYTYPPQRPWVGLTDEEMDEWTPEIHGVIRSIEAALRSKNT